MKIGLSLLLILICLNLQAQNKLHVQYINVRSEVATINEDLYVLDENVISIQDSVFQSLNVHNAKLYHPNKIKYISTLTPENIGHRDFFFNKKDRFDNLYFIFDKVPNIDWQIELKSTKKILGYSCFRATAEFRGSRIVAFFTNEIPISVGPFKFYGLPGLILEVKEENKPYDIWKAKIVEFDFKENIDFKPIFKNVNKISMKGFWEIENENQAKELKDLQNLFPNSSVSLESINELEDKFEWE